MTEVNINPGVCGFKTVVKIESEDMQIANIEVKTDCPNIKAFEHELTEVDAYEVCFAKLGDSTVYELGRKYCKHAACPVPCGIVKGIEVECGLALPRDVEIKLSKE